MTLKNLTLIAASMLLSLPAMADNFGYSDGTVVRNNVFRVGSTTKQGLAIKLSHDKLQMFKGQTIDGVQASVGSSYTTGKTLDIFVATSLDGEPLATQQVSITGAIKWIDLKFDTPYVITGDEEALYVGYTGEAETTTNLLMGDGGDAFEGFNFAFRDTEWTDIASLGKGNANVRAIIGGDTKYADAMIKSSHLSGYYKAGTSPDLSAEIFNFGNEELKSFDIEVKIGDAEPVKTSYSNLSIAQGKSFTVAYPEFETSESALYPISVEVKNVNGADDMCPADNKLQSSIFLYPADMQRRVLIEGFTGQACGNCPTGHKTLAAFIESLPEESVIEIMHHSGYQPDRMTMDADLDYTYFYGSSGTYAPAVMVNRMHAGIGNWPVMNTNLSNLNTAYAMAVAEQPYVAIDITSSYDADTRKAVVNVKTKTLNDIPSEVAAFNVAIVQDGIIGTQSGAGDAYVHNAVFRGTLIDNSWGLQLPADAMKMGGTYEWSTEYTVPEGIYSDYWDKEDIPEARKPYYTMATDPSKMRFVAYVSAFGNTPNDMQVYNAAEVMFDGSVAALSALTASPVAIRVVDGKIISDGDCDNLSVYGIDGKQANNASRLQPGMYIVRAAKGANVTVKKVVVK